MLLYITDIYINTYRHVFSQASYTCIDQYATKILTAMTRELGNMSHDDDLFDFRFAKYSANGYNFYNRMTLLKELKLS